MTSDSELVDRVTQGDIEAFGELVSRYERSVFAVTMAILRDAASSEDASQEAFIRAFGQICRLRDGSRFGPWLIRIARREALQVIRRCNRQSAVYELAARDVHEASDDHGQRNDERRQQLLVLIQRLPAHERLIVTLRYFDDHSIREISEMTGRPIGTVTKQLSRALERLRADNGLNSP